MHHRSGASDRVTVRLLGGEEEDFERMAEDIRTGLLFEPKDLSPWPKYFYDEKGSEIFEEITALPEYYQTRTELSILKEKSSEIVARTRCRELVELGSGSASKTRALLETMIEARESSGPAEPIRYVPLDVSESALEASAQRLVREYRTLEVSGFVGDFDHSLEYLLAHPRQANGFGRLVIFLGGTIGNFTPEQRRSFLERLQAGLKEGDHILVGLDLIKSRNVLEAAYDDAAGVTSRFNKNLLNVLNRKLGGEFDPDLFDHRVIYNAEAERVEMWLDSKIAQKVPVAALGIVVPFKEGEGIRTEISSKFTREKVAVTFREAGLQLLDLYTDDEHLFGLALGAPTGETSGSSIAARNQSYSSGWKGRLILK
jgi:L-histidine N-alpha-methyltransferase